MDKIDKSNNNIWTERSNIWSEIIRVISKSIDQINQIKSNRTTCYLEAASVDDKYADL